MNGFVRNGIDGDANEIGTAFTVRKSAMHQLGRNLFQFFLGNQPFGSGNVMTALFVRTAFGSAHANTV